MYTHSTSELKGELKTGTVVPCWSLDPTEFAPVISDYWGFFVSADAKGAVFYVLWLDSKFKLYNH